MNNMYLILIKGFEEDDYLRSDDDKPILFTDQVTAEERINLLDLAGYASKGDCEVVQRINGAEL